LLIDAGMSGNKIQSFLQHIGVEGSSLDGILLTHEHADHIAGAGILARRLGLPIYANEKTFAACNGKLGKMTQVTCCVFQTGIPFEMKGMEITPFPISHDAAEPVGFTFSEGKDRIGLATDTGVVTTEIKKHLKACKAVFLEANHDKEMLRSGAYPAYLKARIASELGHLSNDNSAEFAVELVKNGTEALTLGHLSQNNNHPFLAKQSYVFALQEAGIRKEDVFLQVAMRSMNSAFMEV